MKMILNRQPAWALVASLVAAGLMPLVVVLHGQGRIDWDQDPQRFARDLHEELSEVYEHDAPDVLDDDEDLEADIMDALEDKYDDNADEQELTYADLEAEMEE